jgi:tRNA pseudouridine38-40 synthase
MPRVALGISYNGAPWLGWQTQPGGQTVQDQLETALAQFVGQRVATVCAGRTDTGVHALNQVVHLDAPVDRAPMAWIRGLNSLLPPSIAVQWATEVSGLFHARFSAESRSYSYLILNAPVRQPLWDGRAGWCFRPLNEHAMLEGAQCLIGEHDFSSFRSSQCQAASPVRVLHELDVQRSGQFVIVSLKANAFLHHMVRNIVGQLILAGQGKTDVAHVKRVLDGRDRTRAAPTFSAAGLYLTDVKYPESLLKVPPSTSTMHEMVGSSVNFSNLRHDI